MNLHGIVSGAIGTVNPPTLGTIIFASGGYTTDASGRRTPIQDEPRQAMMQVQALTTKDLAQIEGLNVSGSTHTVYINGRLSGLIRTDNKGGDILKFNGRTWQVTCVLEDWPDWTKVAVTLQNGA